MNNIGLGQTTLSLVFQSDTVTGKQGRPRNASKAWPHSARYPTASNPGIRVKGRGHSLFRLLVTGPFFRRWIDIRLRIKKFKKHLK